MELTTDWQHLQRPGFSPDYLEDRYERMDLAYDRGDWVATPAADAMDRNNGPLLAYIAGKPACFTSRNHNFLPGEIVEKQIVVINNSRMPVDCECTWSLALRQPLGGTVELPVETGQQARHALKMPLPKDLAPGSYQLTMTAGFRAGHGATQAARPPQEDRFSIHVLPSPAAPVLPAKIAMFDPRGETGKLLASLGAQCPSVEAGADLSGYDLLILGKGALTADGPAPDLRRVAEGLKVLVFEQTSEALEKRLGFRVQEYGLRDLFPRVANHPALAGLDSRHLCDWRGEATLLPPRLDCEASDRYNGAPAVRWCGLEVPRLWRCGNRGNVASVSIEKPARGDFLPILDGGFSLQYCPLLEYREGRGLILFCQVDVTGRTEDDPAADRLVKNLLGYAASWKPAPRRKALYVGEPSGRACLESLGIRAEQYQGGELGADQVLVVAPGGGAALAPHAPAIASWLKAGGHLLALELDAEEANRFLPSKIRTTKQEHIAACFDPPGIGSLLAGVGPADVHNRDPRELPLVSDGAQVRGNGVLAQMAYRNVVFCQLSPARVAKPPIEQQNLRRTYRRASFLVARLLANMGVSADTPLVARFSTPVSELAGDLVLRNGDFRLDTDGDGMPDDWQFSSSSKEAACRIADEPSCRCLRMTCPGFGEKDRGDLMLAQSNVPMKAGQWYRIGLRARAEGLEGGVTLAVQDTTKWQSLVEYRRFAPAEAWKEFTFLVESKATASKTRFQIWHSQRGTLWISDVRMAPCDPPTHGRWTNGLYADEPREWNDPYRFFRW